MVKTSFYIDKPKSNKSTIMINISLNGFRLQISTGVSVPTKVWLKDKQAIKSSYSTAMELNANLKHLERQIVAFCTQAKLNGLALTKEQVREKFIEIRDPKSGSSKPELTLVDAMEKFIDYRKTINRPKTIVHFYTILNHLNNFEGQYGITLFLTSLSEELWNKFEEYLYSGNINDNTLDSINKNIRVLLQFCLKRNLIDDSLLREYFTFIQRIRVKESVKVALTEDELFRLFDYCPTLRKLEKTKDLFLVQCYTGLRYSDLSNLKPENIDLKEQIIKVSTIKTSKEIIIPISSKILPIFIKWDFQLPIIDSSQYNRNIKQMFKELEFDSPVQTVTFQGRKRIETTKPKYELISSHTARRTMITLALKKGMLPEMVMKISGHTSRESFEKYVKITEEEARKQFRELF